MNGWRYEWIQTLPLDVYDAILEEMRREVEEREEREALTHGGHSTISG